MKSDHSLSAPSPRYASALELIAWGLGTVAPSSSYCALSISLADRAGSRPGLQIRRRRPTPRPGVTAAATTAVFATGEGPGDTAFATTAVLATGCPITPTRPARAALSGISDSFCCECFVGLDRGDDGLNGYPSVRDQLTA